MSLRTRKQDAKAAARAGAKNARQQAKTGAKNAREQAKTGAKIARQRARQASTQVTPLAQSARQTALWNAVPPASTGRPSIAVKSPAK